MKYKPSNTSLRDHKLIQILHCREVKERKQIEHNGKKQTEEETKLVKQIENFVPLSQALDVDWTSKIYANKMKRISPAYFIMQGKNLKLFIMILVLTKKLII